MSEPKDLQAVVVIRMVNGCYVVTKPQGAFRSVSEHEFEKHAIMVFASLAALTRWLRKNLGDGARWSNEAKP